MELDDNASTTHRELNGASGQTEISNLELEKLLFSFGPEGEHEMTFDHS